MAYESKAAAPPLAPLVRLLACSEPAEAAEAAAVAPSAAAGSAPRCAARRLTSKSFPAVG